MYVMCDMMMREILCKCKDSGGDDDDSYAAILMHVVGLEIRV